MIATLGPRDAVLVDDWAKSNDFDVGDTLSIKTPAGKTIVLTVRGTVDNKGDIFNPVTTTYRTVRRDFRQPDDVAGPDQDRARARTSKAVQARIDKLLDANFPIVRSRTSSSTRTTSRSRSTSCCS